MMNEKIKKISQWLAQNELDIAFINNPTNIAYFTGYQSNPHERILALIISANNDYFIFAPALEVAEAKQKTGVDVHGYKDGENPWHLIAKQIKAKCWTAKTWAIETDFLTVERHNAIQENFPQATLTHDLTPTIQQMMVIKSPDEIAKMIEAGKWADYALEVGFKALKTGASEAEIVAQIEYELKKQGIKQMSFDTLVLIGDHAASPHGEPGIRQLQKNELVLFDLGVVYDGYTSDVTRTVAFGEVSDLEQTIYQLVLKANLAAIAAIKPGVTAGELDAIARTIITDAGYGEYFIHRLGHGLGSTVHEYPSIMAGSDFVIEEGMCFSIEPGIYIPNKVGVRIEDCIYVTATGCEVFTHTPKALQTL